jgi:hypothetical protein
MAPAAQISMNLATLRRTPMPGSKGQKACDPPPWPRGPGNQARNACYLSRCLPLVPACTAGPPQGTSPPPHRPTARCQVPADHRLVDQGCPPRRKAFVTVPEPRTASCCYRMTSDSAESVTGQRRPRFQRYGVRIRFLLLSRGRGRRSGAEGQGDSRASRVRSGGVTGPFGMIRKVSRR